MDVESLINKKLILSSIENGSFNYSIPIKSNIQKFYEQNNESTPLLFEYILYKIIYFKIKNNIELNPDIIIISEEYLKNNENIIKEKNLFFNKLFLIPLFDNSDNKWGLMIFSNLFSYEENKEVIVKIITSNKNYKNIKKH